MKCKDYNYCHKVSFDRWSNAENRWVTYDQYQCFGVKEPFVIKDIDVECTEYEYNRGKTAEEVGLIDAISHFKYGISHDIFKEPVTSYAQIAVEALEKQMPKKPIGDLHSVPHYRCPNCNNAVVVYDHDYKYQCCKWCGQKLNWD